MADFDVDLLVIGFGKGGKTLAADRGRAGRRVLLVEQSDQMYGGTCINVGCVPTKSLVHLSTSPGSGEEDAWYRESIEVTADLVAAMRQKNFTMLDQLDSVTVVTGKAKFISPHEVVVTGGEVPLTVSAAVIVINTGATPVIPEFAAGLDLPGVYTSATLLQQAERPRRLAILGAGNIGLEFAGIYAGYGSEVTVFDQSPAILTREDPDVAAAVQDLLQDQGVRFELGVSIDSLAEAGDVTSVVFQRNGATEELLADAVLIALGRRPLTDGLGLEAAGVAVTPHGAVEVNQYLQSSQPHIYAIGDVNGGPQFTYVSLDDYRIVKGHLAGEATRATGDRGAIPTTLFITPPLSRIGLTERQALESGYRLKVASMLIAEMPAAPRYRITGDVRGFMKFVVDADTDLILGCALLNTDSQELINLVSLAMRRQVTASELREAIYTHPSSTEAFNTVLGKLD
ncbi:MAG: FAD-dependent oxidoreductase [Renibacterium sp.]|nr:FAD-dependent oxidoreductase [Renibacterium sp.]